MKRTVLVLAAALGLGAFLYYYEIKGGEKREDAEKQARKVFSLREDEVTRIRIDNEYGPIDLSKSSGKWMLASPVSTVAEESSVTSLLAALGSAETKGTLEKPGDLAGFGLKPPKITLRIEGDGRSETVKIGKRSPVSQDLYVMRNDDPKVYMATGGLDGSPARRSDEFRDKKLFAFAATMVTAVRIVSDSPPVWFRKTADGWRMETPAGITVDDGAIETFTQDLAGLRVSSWLTENASPADLDKYIIRKPAATLEVTLAGGQVQRLLFGPAKGNDRVLRVEGRPQIVQVADFSAKQLLKTAEDFRDHRLTRVSASEFGKMVFHTGSERTVAFRRTGGRNWAIEGSASGVADTRKAELLATVIAEFRVTQWMPTTPALLKAHQLTPPIKTLEVYDKKDKLLFKATFGSEVDGWAVWMQTGDPRIEAKAPSDLSKNKWPNDVMEYFATPASAPVSIDHSSMP